MNKLFRRFGARRTDAAPEPTDRQIKDPTNGKTNGQAKATSAQNGQSLPDQKTEQKVDQHYALTPDSDTAKTLTLTTPAPKVAALHTATPTEPTGKPSPARHVLANHLQANSAQAHNAPANVAPAPQPDEDVAHAPYPSPMPEEKTTRPEATQDGATTPEPSTVAPAPAAMPLREQAPPEQKVEKRFALTPETSTPQTHTLTSASPEAAALHTATPSGTPAAHVTTATAAKAKNGAARGPNGNGLIQLNNVNKAYQTPVGEFVALRNINLTIGRGEFVAVVGKSGSGKSTLINMITGIDRPTSGEIFIENTAIHNLAEGPMAEWRGRNIGIIFQFFQLLPMLSCIENVMLPMDFCNMFKPSERESRALHLLEQVDMAEHAYKLPSEVSGGQQQRVAIARALANDPPLLVADEPTGNLDSRTADAVFQLFSRMVDDGKTILMVTHDDEMAHQVRRTITLTDGQIVDDQTLHPQENRAAAGEMVAQV